MDQTNENATARDEENMKIALGLNPSDPHFRCLFCAFLLALVNFTLFYNSLANKICTVILPKIFE